MKINFQGSYKDIQHSLALLQRSVSSPPAPQPDASRASINPVDFQSLMVTEAAETPREAPAPQVPPQRIEIPHAKLSIAPLERHAVAIEEAPSVNQEKEGVKSPTLVEVNRIAIPSPLSGLPQGERVKEIRKLVESAGRTHGVDPLLGMAVVSAESSFNPNAISKDGFASKGLMQLLDATGKERLSELEGARASYNPFDPKLNVALGVSHLRHLHDLFSNATEVAPGLTTFTAANSSSLEKLAVAAYNAGQGRVASAQQRAERGGKNPGIYDEVERYLPEITREYVQRVMSRKTQFENEFVDGEVKENGVP